MKMDSVKILIGSLMMAVPTVLLSAWYLRVYYLDSVFIVGIVSWLIGVAVLHNEIRKGAGK